MQVPCVCDHHMLSNQDEPCIFGHSSLVTHPNLYIAVVQDDLLWSWIRLIQAAQLYKHTYIHRTSNSKWVSVLNVCAAAGAAMTNAKSPFLWLWMWVYILPAKRRNVPTRLF